MAAAAIRCHLWRFDSSVDSEVAVLCAVQEWIDSAPKPTFPRLPYYQMVSSCQPWPNSEDEDDDLCDDFTPLVHLPGKGFPLSPVRTNFSLILTSQASTCHEGMGFRGGFSCMVPLHIMITFYFAPGTGLLALLCSVSHSGSLRSENEAVVLSDFTCMLVLIHLLYIHVTTNPQSNQIHNKHTFCSQS